jgi:hypothetical protein
VSVIWKPNEAQVRCQCIVDLIGRAADSFLKPNYRFLVTVWGEWPHHTTRRYEIVAYGEETAAHLGIQQFQRDVSKTRALLATL